MSDGQLEAQADGSAAVNLVTGFPAATQSVTQVGGEKDCKVLSALKYNHFIFRKIFFEMMRGVSAV